MTLAKRAMIALAAVLMIGCGEDVSSQIAAWDTLRSGTETKISGFKTQLETLKGALGALPKFEGFGALTEKRNALEAKINGLSDMISGAEGSLKEQGEALVTAFGKKKIADADSALASAQEAIDGTIASCTEGFASAQSELDAVSSYGKAFTGIGTVTKAASEVHDPKATGHVDFLDVNFKPASAEFDLSEGSSSQAALDRMVALTSACDEMKFEIHGHSSKEGGEAINKKLSGERAEAIKAYLLGHDVEAGQILKTEGNGFDHTAVDEPEPKSPEAEAMDKDFLEAIRAVNRRVSIDITEACPAS